ncbi:DNA -binding domain-containing protein [Stutzerimonas sp. NM35]
MAHRNAEQKCPTAAYLYLLHLDEHALAWEYLRRNPEYRRDWQDCVRRAATAHRWGLRVLEDPGLDARDAHPLWLVDHPRLVQLHPDVYATPDAAAFNFWRIPGRKGLVHDGLCLRVATSISACRIRLAMAPGLKDGDAFVVAMRPGRLPGARARVMTEALNELAAGSHTTPLAQTFSRPSATALLELHTLQALDASLAGASLREVALCLFGSAAVTQGWHADASLRSKVRRLVRRGRRLMLDDYRRLARLDLQGRAVPSHHQNDPEQGSPAV